jgi:hypothetical protein
MFEEEKGKTESKKAMTTKDESIMKNQIWDLTNLPPGKKPIGCKWLYKVKYKLDGPLNKYKAWLVAKVFLKLEGIDYEGNLCSYNKDEHH